MRYWSYNELEDDGSNLVVTLSEDEILNQFYPYWSSRMIAKFGQEVFERDWCKKDCIDDWVVVNWAWESTPY